MSGTQRPNEIFTRLQWIAELAREKPTTAFTALAHHIDQDLMKEAYRRTRKSGAVGVDEVTAEQYAENLDANLESLLNRFKSGTYWAPPVRRVHIPKGDGKSTRPIGIPTFEDKILQRAVTMILDAIYEQDFLECSWGFRRKRSARDAVMHLRKVTMTMDGGWVIELDIQKFFDTLKHDVLRSFLDQRIRDGVIRRTIGKWLHAGVLEGTELTHPDEGTPQGGVISPLLANIYLHEVLDKWFEHDVKPRLRGRAHLVRYADDAVIVIGSEEDARRVMEVLPERFKRFGLTLHPEKTTLVPFRRPRSDQPLPGNFNFLGFTFLWAKARTGSWVIKMKTATQRLARSLKKVVDWVKRNRHEPLKDQHRTLLSKIRGHVNYYGTPGNSKAVQRFVHFTEVAWKKWLSRRSQRNKIPGTAFDAIIDTFPLRLAYPTP